MSEGLMVLESETSLEIRTFSSQEKRLGCNLESMINRNKEIVGRERATSNLSI